MPTDEERKEVEQINFGSVRERSLGFIGILVLFALVFLVQGVAIVVFGWLFFNVNFKGKSWVCFVASQAVDD